MLFETAADELPYLHALVVGGKSGCERLRRMLRRLGIMRITVAAGTAEALRKLSEARRPVDIVISDNDHDNTAALELLKMIRRGEAKGARPSMCFLMMSGVRERHMVELAAALDVHHYVVKPVSVDKLQAAIVKARAHRIFLHPTCYMSVLIPSGTADHAWR